MTVKQQSRKDLRRETLTRRDKMEVESRRRRSAALVERLWRLPPFAEAGHIFTYINFRSEVETLSLIRQCLARDIVVSAPVTMTAELRLIARRLTDPDRGMRPGYCGIPEPDPAHSAIIDPADIEVVILPGSVFDEYGGRLGYGGGYYDRFLADEAPQALRIGVAFELQIMEQKLPLMPHDKMLDYLVTEKRILDCKRIKI
ncbi:MAG: 5-formyltetrahydrofolate cyclo-ligase [Deltaproteobacteria bacterium]|nr:5-formyltetrahydrofolate cyclo-ligase [Deltaproteobacteria bacterium]